MSKNNIHTTMQGYSTSAPRRRHRWWEIPSRRVRKNTFIYNIVFGDIFRGGGCGGGAKRATRWRHCNRKAAVTERT